MLVTELVLTEVTPSLNVYQRMHRQVKKNLRNRLLWTFKSQPHHQHKGRVRLEVFRHSSGTLDYDNLVGGCKPAIDALKLAGIIIDDKPKFIPEREYNQVKVLRAGVQMTVFRITDLD